MRTYQVISADGHIEGPFDWNARMPAKYKGAAPRLVNLEEEGRYVWRTEWAGVQEEYPIGGGLYCGMRYDEFLPEAVSTYWNPDGSPRPGTAVDPVQRLREQDIDGIDAEILFLPAGIRGRIINALIGHDPDAHRAVIRMYNDFITEYCSVAPDRLIAGCMVPETGVGDAIAEITYARKQGIRHVVLMNWPNGSGSPALEDDRFWAAAQDLDIKISPHGSFGAGQLKPHPISISDENALSGQRIMGGQPTATIAQLTSNGVFDRFPNLKIYFAETQATWLAGHLDYVDEFYNRWAYYHGLDKKLKKQPSQYIRDHCRFSFIHDRLAMQLRHFIGLDLLMWGSDFPHSVGTYPDSRVILEDLFDGVPKAERRKVLVDNVCEFFGLDPQAAITETPGATIAAR